MKNLEVLSNLGKENVSISGAEVMCMKDVEMKPISWLWPDRIARGKLTVIAGNPGLGKSQITASLAAIISSGLPWPDTFDPTEKGGVIFLSAEDDPADTIKPRLIAAGADMNDCHVLQAVKTVDEKGAPGTRTFDLTQDINLLGQEISKVGNIKLVIIDPISAYLGDTESHNNAEMRGLLAPLADMAAKHGVAIVLLTHLNKSQNQDMIARVIGSIGLVAAARSGYAVVKDPQKPEIRYFLPIKNNIGNDSNGFAFSIEGVYLEENIQTSRVRWGADLIDAQKIFYPEPEKTSGTNGAAGFLKELLSGKEMAATDVFSEAEGAGYSKPTIQRAARRLNVRRKKHGMEGGWFWSLPQAHSEGGEDAEDYIFGEQQPSPDTPPSSEDEAAHEDGG